MSRISLLIVICVLCLSAAAQQPIPGAPRPPREANAPIPTPKVSIYLEAPGLDYATLIPPPPPADSAAARADLAEVLRVQNTRTPADVLKAQHDEKSENMFLFDTVLGSKFNAEALPLTAALSRHVGTESGIVNGHLKAFYNHPRPFVVDPALQPVCQKLVSPSYPSGHSMAGYLEAFTLAQIVPEQSSAILQRADEFAHNRVVCGVHFPSDTVSAHEVSLALFGQLAASPAFQRELAAARAEVRKQLNLSALPASAPVAARHP